MHSKWSDDDVQHEVSEGRWVADNLNFTPKTTVGSLVPAHFEAFARILHPVRTGGGKYHLVRWSDVARHTGAIAHAEMELHTLQSKQTDHSRPVASASPVPPWRDQLASIAQVLSGHTRTQDDCWFAIWEGNTALDDIRDARPTVAINGDNYFLLRGDGGRATDDYRGLGPNIWWPADHSWCAVAHFDFPCLYLGGSAHAISDVLDMPQIEAWPARVNQIITADNDHLNR